MGNTQGSISGSLLFIIYMNDICNVQELLFTVLYTDETSVLIYGKDNDKVEKLAFNMVKKQLSLNTDKTYIIFHRARIKLPDIESPIIMNNPLLSTIQHHTYLCIILDCKMPWIQNLTYVKNNVANGICIMFNKAIIFL